MMHSVPAWLIVPIPILYLIFAAQLVNDTKANKDSKAKRALYTLGGVFVFCAIVGYVNRLFPIPLWAADVFHGLLILAMVFVVVTRQSIHIARALDAVDDA